MNEKLKCPNPECRHEGRDECYECGRLDTPTSESKTKHVQVKKPEGTEDSERGEWKCTRCHSPNKAGMNKCSTCDKQREGEKKSPCGDVEFGECEVCKKVGPLSRTYIHFDYKCECHSPQHFILISHCDEHAPTNERAEASEHNFTIEHEALVNAEKLVDELKEYQKGMSSGAETLRAKLEATEKVVVLARSVTLSHRHDLEGVVDDLEVALAELDTEQA